MELLVLLYIYIYIYIYKIDAHINIFKYKYLFLDTFSWELNLFSILKELRQFKQKSPSFEVFLNYD